MLSDYELDLEHKPFWKNGLWLPRPSNLEFFNIHKQNEASGLWKKNMTRLTLWYLYQLTLDPGSWALWRPPCLHLCWTSQCEWVGWIWIPHWSCLSRYQPLWEQQSHCWSSSAHRWRWRSDSGPRTAGTKGQGWKNFDTIILTLN